MAPPSKIRSVRDLEVYRNNRLRQGIVAATPELENEGASLYELNGGRRSRNGRRRVWPGARTLRRAGAARRYGPERPHAPRAVRHERRTPAWLSFFSGKDELLAVMQRTETEGLFVVTAGSPVANPFSLFESASINALIEEMRKAGGLGPPHCAPGQCL